MGVKEEGKSKKSSGKIVMLGGIVLALIGFAFLGSGVSIWYLNGSQDAEGYTISNVYTVDVPQNVFLISIRAEHPGLMTSLMMNFMKHEDIHQAKWVVQGDGSKQLFVGFATVQTINSVMSGYEFSALDYSWDSGFYYSALFPYQLQTYNKGGGAVPVNAIAGVNLLSKNQSSGTSTIHFDPYFGEGNDLRTLIIMNADGSPGVKAELGLGWRNSFLDWLYFVLIPIGAILMIIGILLMVRRR